MHPSIARPQSLPAGPFLLPFRRHGYGEYQPALPELVETWYPGGRHDSRSTMISTPMSSGRRTAHTILMVPPHGVTDGDEGLIESPGKSYPDRRIRYTNFGICLGGAAVGVSRAAYETALLYARQRKQYGRPIIENQAIYFMLADMATEIEAARLLTWKAAWLVDQGMDSTKVASMCKVSATEMAERVCSRAIQILGGQGYTRNWPVEKYYRDAKAMAIYEGTNQIQRMIIASML